MYTCLHIKRKNKKVCRYKMRRLSSRIDIVHHNKQTPARPLSNEIESFSIDSFHCTAV